MTAVNVPSIVLLPQHRELLAAHAISDNVAVGRGYRSIEKAEARDLGFTQTQARPGLLIPLWRVDGVPGGYQLRPDNPRLTKDGKPIKYETPRGQRNVLDVPPTVRDALHKGREVVLITEGAFKADALATLVIPVINVAGVYGWRGRNEAEGYTALADWEMVNIKGNIFVLAFDSDILEKQEVHQALGRLKRWLEYKGAAQVRVLVLPPLLSGKTGVDDYIAATGATAEDLARLVVDVLPAPPEEAVGVPDGEPVDLATLLNDARGMVRRYVVMSEHQADAVSLWTAHTHAIEAAECTPYLHVTSPEKQSGKTRLLEVLALLVARPWFTARVSAAVLVRKVARDAPTLLLDETDSAFRGEKEYAEALRALLNAGYRKGGVASLCVKKGSDFDLVDFPVFCAKALAGIGQLPDTVADRSIRLNMKRRAPGEKVARFRLRTAQAEATPLHERLEQWAKVAVTKLAEARPVLPEALSDRACDVWEHLLAIADAAGGDWPRRGRDASLVLSGSDADDDLPLGAQLLRDLKEVLAGRESPVPSAELVAALVDREESPWGDLRGRPLDARKLASLLKPYGIKPKVIRVGDMTPRGYHPEDFSDAFARYLHTPGISATSATSETKTTPQLGLADLGPENVAAVAAVADKKGIRSEVLADSFGGGGSGDGGDVFPDSTAAGRKRFSL